MATQAKPIESLDEKNVIPSTMCCHYHAQSTDEKVAHYKLVKDANPLSFLKLNGSEINDLIKKSGGSLLVCTGGCICGNFTIYNIIAASDISLYGSCNTACSYKTTMVYIYEKDDWEFVENC